MLSYLYVLNSCVFPFFACLQVLQDLIEEDERVLETWYLFAMCLHAGGEHGEAASAVERGQALAKTLGMPADDPLVLAFADTKVGAKSASMWLPPFRVRCLVLLLVSARVVLSCLLPAAEQPISINWLPTPAYLPCAS
jgi:hypothetical protein